MFLNYLIVAAHPFLINPTRPSKPSGFYINDPVGRNSQKQRTAGVKAKVLLPE